MDASQLFSPTLPNPFGNAGAVHNGILTFLYKNNVMPHVSSRMSHAGAKKNTQLPMNYFAENGWQLWDLMTANPSGRRSLGMRSLHSSRHMTTHYTFSDGILPDTSVGS